MRCRRPGSDQNSQMPINQVVARHLLVQEGQEVASIHRAHPGTTAARQKPGQSKPALPLWEYLIYQDGEQLPVCGTNPPGSDEQRGVGPARVPQTSTRGTCGSTLLIRVEDVVLRLHGHMAGVSAV
jgi:hypothetical protein